ncbi:alginate O-acetyltransferase AlgF [Undibacterium sp. Xuan67W]|uniref:alginate O-acetyltransferase AlgF n=1 Tax=Undibacterium sp. Xuan67W TaxID=3413057 RepID=UPI003BF0F6DE
MKKIIVACIATLVSVAAHADIQLYETGPGEDSSFVRFLNASDDKASVVNGAAKIALGNQGDARVSRFYPVKAGSKLSATVQIGNHKLPVEVTAKPGEFITIAVVGKDAAAKTLIVRETPTDFNAMRSSVSLSNLDEKCSAASLTGGAKNAAIVETVKPATLQRRLINPVKLSVQANCDGQAVGAAIDMSQLQAGERYSVFLLSLKAGRQAFFVRDNNS